MKPVLVIGGGISGVTTAVEIAEVGKEVILIEKEPYFGGNVVKFNNYFPKLCPPTCGLEINFRRIKQNSKIKYFTSTEVQEISGEKGDFKVKIKTAPQYVKNNCTSCGKCIEVCPEERPSDFNYGFTKTKAIYLPHEMAFPYKFNIDDEYCKKELCNKCVEVCEYNAIDLSAKKEFAELEVSSIVVSTGWKNYDASKIENLNYLTSKNIITNVEFERFIASNGVGENKLLRLSDNSEPKKIAFVQCAGSRDENHLPYCSAVCCSASLKHALTIQELYPESEIKIFYIDMRVVGRNEDFLVKVQNNKNIELVKGKVGKINETENNNLILEAEDILSGRKIIYEAEMVVLATGIVPSDLGLDLLKESNGFHNIDQKYGIYVAGCGKKPMDVSASVKDATAVALKAIQIN
ncbi:MAG: CoB--CoM heterodisulfide reductase iron-sulfur subunit A family protein [Bacteroidales bacterium]|jgi:quinone-modifying oxidoreductase subunit QmoA|nr:CoB--CoM heterodisulfide reductase iron-sulfur subunit A family protein [Bacteroidales bacterium]